MKGLCEVDSCQLIARVNVHHDVGGHRQSCMVHWQAAQRSAPEQFGAASVNDLPLCFVHRCGENAVTIVGRYDELPRPVCQRHLDDLSWVDLPEELLIHREPRRG